MTDALKSQADRFKEAARQLETDDDPERFKERLRKLVKHKPVGGKTAVDIEGKRDDD